MRVQLEKKKVEEEQRVREQDLLYHQSMQGADMNSSASSRAATARERTLSAKLEKSRLDTPPQQIQQQQHTLQSQTTTPTPKA